jgi:hypothetical protein
VVCSGTLLQRIMRLCEAPSAGSGQLHVTYNGRDNVRVAQIVFAHG